MAGRSLAFAILAGAVAFVVLTGVWGVLDQGTAQILDDDGWQPDQPADANSDAAKHASEGQGYLADLWTNVPAISAFAISVSLLIRSRGGT